MLKPKSFFIAALLLGVAGGVLRALELRYVYDITTGLARPWHIISLALAGLTALAVLSALLLASKYRPDSSSKNLHSARIPLVIAALILAAGSAAEIFNIVYDNVSITQITLAALGLLTAIVMMLSSATVSSKPTHGMYATIAVFWASFWFLLLFAANAGNPVIGQFWYEFMGVLFSVLSFYFFTGLHFGRARPRLLALSLALSIFFLLTSLVGSALAWMFFPAQSLLDGVTVPGLLRQLFAVIYLLCIPTLIRRVQQMPDEQTGGEDQDDEE